MEQRKRAVIIGAGPAGLTAAFELLVKTAIIPIVIEADTQVGGLSKTVVHNGNRIDIGGHRFFSKSEKVLNWWLRFLPLEADFENRPLTLQYHNQSATHSVTHAAPGNKDQVMLVRNRKSRIFYHNKLFEYPLRLNLATLRKLGFTKTLQIVSSYLYAKTFPLRPEQTLEQFFINNFGKELYETFFKEYTEKVWGVPCNSIPASWGQQRVKDLNITKLIGHAIKSLFKTNKRLDQKGTSTSLIEQFLYPKFGPGQMWEAVADAIRSRGGEIYLQTEVTAIKGDGGHRIRSVETKNLVSGDREELFADLFFSTMPVKELIGNMHHLFLPEAVRTIAASLPYRDFLIVGILTDDILLTEIGGQSISDNWVYIQDRNIQAGRLQLFHNWSPGMVRDASSKWIGAEYFCNETDPFWQQPDEAICTHAVAEMEAIGILDAGSVKDSVVVRVKKAYPSYYGGYKDFDQVKNFLNTIENLFPIGRNGMHRYNNSDHSMLTAMTAVDNIAANRTDKSNIWEINTEEEYHEEKTTEGGKNA